MAQLSPAPPPALTFAGTSRRWVVRGLLALLAVLAILSASVLALAGNLAQPWVKRRVIALVRASSGYEVDYAAAHWEGPALVLEGLQVFGAEPLRALAPTLLQVERVRAELALSAPQLRKLQVERAALTLLFDEDGRTSFDTPPSDAPAKPPTPLSRQAASLLGERLPIERVHIEQLTITLLRSEHGRIVESDTLRGLSLELEAQPVARSTRLVARTSERPVELVRGEQRAEGTLALRLEVTPREASASLRVKVSRQDFVPSVTELARLEAHAVFAQGATELQLRTLELGDGAATAQAALSVPDRGAPHLRHAQGQLEVPRLLALAGPWLPGLELRAGTLHYLVDDFTLDHPGAQASLAVRGELEGLAFEGVTLGRAKLEVTAQPSAEGVRAEGRVTLDRLTRGGVRIHGASMHFTGDVTDRQRGELRVDASFAQVEAPDVRVHGLDLRARVKDGSALDGSLRAERVQIPRQELPLEADFALQGSSLEDVRAKLAARSGAAKLELDATRRGEALDYELRADTPDLTLLEPWLSDPQLTLAEMATTLHSQGRIERLSSEPRLRQRSELRMQHLALKDVRMRALEVDLEGTGDRLRHRLAAELRVHGLQYAGQQRTHDRVQLQLALDRVKPALELSLQTDRRAALQAKLAFVDEAIDYDVSGRFADLSPLAAVLAQTPALAGFDVSGLDVELAARGRLTGVLQRSLALSPDPLRTLGGEGTISLEAKDFRWAQGALAVSVPVASWKARLHGDGARRTVESELVARELEGALGSERLAIAELHDHTAVTLTGGIEHGSVEHTQRLTVRRLQQHLAEGYAVGDLEGSVHATRDADGLIKLHELRVDNRTGGTRLSLAGGLQLTRDERRLSVRGMLEQDLSRLPSFFEGEGKLAMEVTLSSSDFRLFHSAAKLRLEGASVRVPKAKLALESMNGDLPVVTDFLVDRDGVELLRGARINPYAAQRFTDQHPALAYRSFMSIARVQTPYFSFAPFAANLEVARNIVSLSQLELGVRKGTITGSGMFEYDGLDSRVDANLRASGVESSHGEPFDGNAALTIGIRERSVEGRADILRIGRRHLTDLLDLQDPLHADAALNQIRRALRFGYPDRVRLSFQHGFANAGVEFGGLARLIKLNDVRGIPIGPLMERIMATVQPEEASE